MLGPFLGFLCYVLGTKLGGVLLFRMCFEKGVWLFVSCFGSCLIAAAPAAGSSREQQAGSRRQPQAAAGSSRQQQAAAGSSRQQQTPAATSSSTSSRQQQGAAGRQPQAAAGSSRQQQAAGSSRQQAAADTSSRQQQAAAGSRKVSILQYGFRSDVRPFFGVPLLRFGHEIRWWFAVSDVFRKGCLAVCFLLWRLFDCSSTTAAAAATSSCTSSSMVSEVTLGPFLGFLCYVLDTKLGGGLLFRMCFEKGVWLFVSCFGGCLIAAAPQQQQQPPAAAPAAGSSREQQAAAGSRQQQAAAGSSRQQQAAACSSRHQQRRFGHEIRWCFAVSDVFRKGCLAVSFLLWRLAHK